MCKDKDVIMKFRPDMKPGKGAATFLTVNNYSNDSLSNKGRILMCLLFFFRVIEA